MRENPWLQLQGMAHASLLTIAMPDTDRVPQRNEMPIASFCDAKSTRLDVVKPLRSFPV